MKYVFLLTTTLLFFNTAFSQAPSSTEVLNKSIKYHDPKGEWFEKSFSMSFAQTRPDGSVNTIYVDFFNDKSQFRYTQRTDSLSKVYFIKNKEDETVLLLNGSKTISADDAKKHRMTPAMALRIRNYYTYLWGLPMKLKDPGTILHDEVSKEKFQGIDCYKLKVTYDEAVGTDIWYFYFDVKKYALKGYKFHRDESKNDGEYITLEGQEKVLNMKIPKTRKWFYNKGDKFLGEDSLMKR